MSHFDQLPCPVLVTDRSGMVQSVNQSLLDLVGGFQHRWVNQSMDLMFPVASRIFLQTHVWPLIFRESQIREVRLQMLGEGAKQVPVFVNCQQTIRDGIEFYTWAFFVSTERSRFEQELLEARKRAESASVQLANSERFIRTVADAMPSMIAYWDTDLLCQFSNKPYLDWFGRTPEQMVKVPISDVLGKTLFKLNSPYIQSALAGEFQEFESAIVKPDGSVGYVLVNYIPDKDSSGVIKGFFALVTNISHLREADAAIRLSASVFEVTTEGILVTDSRGTIVSVNPAFTSISGYSAKDVVEQHVGLLVSSRQDAAFFDAMFEQLQKTKLWRGDVWCKRKDGAIFPVQLSISAISNESAEITRYVGVFADITEKWDKEQVVRHMALHDGLTGLPNRSLLMERLDQLVAISAREPRRIALMFLDLDGFKRVNDTWGHEVGDQVLKVVSNRLTSLLRPSDTVARLGGDEFVIVVDNADSQESIGLVAERVIEEINAPIDMDGKIAQVGTSIGIAFYQNEITSPDALIKSADDAMYQAKKAGKNTYRFSG